MPKELKEAMRTSLQPRMDEMGDPDFLDKIADETVGETEDEVLEFLTKVNHPALTMDSAVLETPATSRSRTRGTTNGSERNRDLQAAAEDQLRRLRRARPASPSR